MNNNVIDQIHKAFSFHSPKADEPERYDHIRDFGRQFAFAVIDYCPESRERSLALTKIEEAVMWANAAIARNE